MGNQALILAAESLIAEIHNPSTELACRIAELRAQIKLADEPTVSSILRWVCPICDKEHREEKQAIDCMRRCKCATAMWREFESGKTLAEIIKLVASEDLHLINIKGLEDTTAKHGFVISHWQCCEHPAYHIVAFDNMLRPHLYGAGNWMGAFGYPIPWEELQTYERYNHIWRYGE